MLRLLAVVVLVSVPAFAANPVIVDSADEPSETIERCVPAIACAAKLGGEAALGVEAGSDGRGSDGQFVQEGQMIFKYAAASRVELQLYTSPLILAGSAPRSAPAVQPGVKVSLLEEDDFVPAVAVSLYFTLPAADPQQTYDFEGWLGFSKTWGPVKAMVDLMAAVGDVGGQPTSQGLALLSLNSDLGQGLSLFGFAFGTFGETRDLAPGVGVSTGVSFVVTDGLVADVGTELAFHEQPMVTVFAGLTWTPQLDAPEQGASEPAPASRASAFAPGLDFVAQR